MKRRTQTETDLLAEFARKQLPRRPWISKITVTIKVPEQYAKMILELAHEWEEEDRNDGLL
jgi:hypothetical protein